jgi:hypothetical protein
MNKFYPATGGTGAPVSGSCSAAFREQFGVAPAALRKGYVHGALTNILQ